LSYFRVKSQIFKPVTSSGIVKQDGLAALAQTAVISKLSKAVMACFICGQTKYLRVVFISV